MQDGIDKIFSKFLQHKATLLNMELNPRNRCFGILDPALHSLATTMLKGINTKRIL